MKDMYSRWLPQAKSLLSGVRRSPPPPDVTRLLKWTAAPCSKFHQNPSEDSRLYKPKLAYNYRT